MADNSDLNESVCVSFTISEWAQVVAAVATSRLDLVVKEQLNSAIYDCVIRTERILS